MNIAPILAEVLRALAAQPARHRLAARTVLWGAAAALSVAGLVFALIGLHRLLFDLMGQVAASFVVALILIGAAGLLALGAWLAGPRGSRPAPDDSAAAVVLAGFLDGLAAGNRASDKPDGGTADRDH